MEGVPTVLLGILTIFLLPDRPEETLFLTERERKLQMERMNRGITADIGRTVNKGTYEGVFTSSDIPDVAHRACQSRIQGLEGRNRHVSETFTTYNISQIYKAGVIYFGANCALASISAFLPTIIKTFGFSRFTTLSQMLLH